MPLVVAAEELLLLAALPDQQQQVPVGGLHVEDGDLGVGLGLADDLEELALAVGPHVQGDDARGGPEAAGGTVGDLEPGPDPGELGEQVVVSIAVPPWDKRHQPWGSGSPGST